MTQYVIPLDNIPSQTFEIELQGKNCRFEFITRGVWLFMNLQIDDEDIINGVLCLDRVNLINYTDIGLDGSIYFEDTQGNLDPIYWGLNDRWLLIYEVEDA